jgi:trehalose/maltose transport system permease protein
MMWRPLKKTAFYALVVAIVLESLFPFYYAILTSFKSGTSLFEVNYWPTMVSWDNYATIFESGSFPRNLLNSVVVTTLTVASAQLLAVTAAYALSRVRFQGRSLLLLTILSVSMFPQMVVLAGLFEVIRFFGLFNSIWGLIFS